jgi:nicotinate-nucleotide adenylyltransferase
MGGRIGLSATNGERWGMLGGLFDPIHYGHLAIAEQARDALGFAKVVFMPAGRPVHKDGPRESADHRLRMLELATADNPAFEVSRLEIDADRPSYTVDTLETLCGEHPDQEWTIIVSAEAARALPSWRQPDRILEMARVAVVSREGYEDLNPAWLSASFPGREHRFSVLETSRLGNSSTDIRTRIAAGRSIRYLVPPSVEAYIGDNRLYGASDGRTPA